MFWITIRYNMQKRIRLMKRLAPFLVAVVGMMALSLSVAFAASSSGVTIESIAHTIGSETEEKLIFKLSAQVGTKIYTMKGDNPRLIIDFPNSSYTGKSVIPLVDGKLATTIRSGLHQAPEQKTRIVIDLAKQIPVRFTSDYSEADNILTVILLSDVQEPPQKKTPPAPAVKQEVAAPLPKSFEAVVAAKPVEEKPMPPRFPPQEPTKKAMDTPPIETVTPGKSENPKLLNISFDDSSTKGEMVLFHLTAFQPPMVSAAEKDNPKVFCDFMGMELSKGVEVDIAAKGKFVERISTSKHSKPDKIRVVLNLSPNRDYDLQQVFFKNDNLFVLIVNELPLEKSAQ
jgi:hypothetical protein